MKLYHRSDSIEAGIDEAGRGCLLGRVYAAAVIWPQENDDDYEHPIMKDSKRFSREKREEMYDYVKENAIDYAFGYADEKEIDSKNILQANYLAMHRALDKLNLDLDYIIVDGNNFKPYLDSTATIIPHKCIVKGDTLYYSIAAASIIAKCEHDKYIQNLCNENPELNEKYNLLSNMGYGSKTHLEGIKEHGISKYHRKSFKCCI